MMKVIIDYKINTATGVSKSNMYVVPRHDQKKPRKVTRGWKLLVKWKDENESWTHLKYLKEPHPVELAEYAKSRVIVDAPAFIWWVPYILIKRDIILSVAKKHMRKTHKYGIELYIYMPNIPTTSIPRIRIR